MFKHYKLLTGLLAFLFYNSIYAQNVTVNGSVVSKSDNKPLPGVTILVEGSSKGTKTDNDGHFTLTSPANSVATFSFVGFQPQKVTLSSSTTTVNIALENA